MPNTTPREETASVGPEKATVHEEKHAHSSMTRARKAKGRNDLVPLSPAGSLHRNSKGDGKGCERRRKCWRHPKLIGKSPSGKANRRPCTNVKKGSCQERNPCDYWHAPECTKFRAPGKCRYSETSGHTSTHQNLLMKRKIHHWSRFTIHRMMNDRCNYGKFSPMTRLNTECGFITETSMFSKHTNWQPALGVIQTGSQKMRNRKSSTFEERSIEWILSTEENTRKAVRIFEKGTRKKFQDRILRIDIGSSSQVPRAMFLHLLSRRRKGGNSLWSRELHFIWWVQSNVTPEEQETIEKSKDTSVIMSAKWTSHTTVANRKCLWFGHVCSSLMIEKHHPRYFRSGTRMNGI